MEQIELQNLTDCDNVVICAIMDKNEITNKLKKVNGYPFNYFLLMNKEIVYIGYSSSLYQRLLQHKYYKNFDKIILVEFTDEKSARFMERKLIKTYKPKLNYQYNI